MDLSKLIIEKSKIIIAVIASDGKLKYASDSLFEVLGYHPSERKGLNVFDFIHPDDVHGAKAALKDLLKKNQSTHEMQYRHKHADGSWRWIEMTARNYTDHPGIAGIIINARDISDLKIAESTVKITNQSLQSILENLPLAIFAHNLDGEILYVNENTVHYTGYSKHDLLKMRIDDIDEGVLTRKDREKKWEMLKPGIKETFRVTHNRKDGSTYPAEVSLSPVLINGEQILLAVVDDITERIKAEDALVTSEKNLRQLNVTKDKFFKIISHDLKGPIGSINGLAKIICDRYEKLGAEKVKELIDRICETAESTENLLSDLLAWSQSQSGSILYNPEAIPVHDFLSGNIDVIRGQAKVKDIQIFNEADKGLFIYADKNALNTVVRNLLLNAIKFSNRGGIVRTFANKIHYDNRDFVMLEVADNGIGIDKVRTKKLFSLEHADSTPGTENEKGTGLGLIVCKEFVEKNHGKISFKSELGKGTSFFVYIPCSRE